MKEIWKYVVSNNDYKVSNLGRVKSLKWGKERVLKQGCTVNGYALVILHSGGIKKTRNVHQLVAEAFLNHIPNGNSMVVNHIDFNKKNNNIKNLEVVTHKENGNMAHIKSTSKYVGVFWCKSNKKWISTLCINKKQIRLGYFKNEYEAYLARENKEKEVKTFDLQYPVSNGVGG